MKKILILIICLIFMISGNPFNNIVIADDYDETDEYIEENEFNETVETASKVTEEPQVKSRSIAVFDRTAKEVIYGKNENKRVAMASTTKIMTSIIVLENANLNDEVEVSSTAASIGGSRLGLKKGDKITVLNLLYGLMLRSGNDAAYALAEHIGGSKEGFAEYMNNKANELGLKNTHFVTPHGLDDPNHYTTATELAIITDYALKNETFAKIVNTKTYTININGHTKTISNTNELLGNLQGVNGVKTGFTNNAGRCLVTSINRDGWNIICVVLGADTKKMRTTDSIKLIEYTYKNYTRVNIEEKLYEQFKQWKNIHESMITVNKAKNKKIDLEIDFTGEKIRAIKNTEIDNIDFEMHILKELEAPICTEDVIGNIVIKNDDKILETIEITNKYDIEKNDVNNYLEMFINNFAKGEFLEDCI